MIPECMRDTDVVVSNCSLSGHLVPNEWVAEHIALPISNLGP